MAYFSIATAPERRNLTGKNRVWDFFPLSNETHPVKRRQPLQPRRKIGPTAMKTASGIPYWPSRDPVEETAGMNLYGFVGNNGIYRSDPLGLCDIGVNNIEFLGIEYAVAPPTNMAMTYALAAALTALPVPVLPGEAEEVAAEATVQALVAIAGVVKIAGAKLPDVGPGKDNPFIMMAEASRTLQAAALAD